MLSSSGISCRHGPHHVAQKLIITTLPLNWLRSTVEPPRPDSWKAGAGLDEEANTGRTNAAASTSPFENPLIVRTEIMKLTPSEEDGRTQQGLDVVGDLGLA